MYIKSAVHWFSKEDRVWVKGNVIIKSWGKTVIIGSCKVSQASCCLSEVRGHGGCFADQWQEPMTETAGHAASDRPAEWKKETDEDRSERSRWIERWGEIGSRSETLVRHVCDNLKRGATVHDWLDSELAVNLADPNGLVSPKCVGLWRNECIKYKGV